VDSFLPLPQTVSVVLRFVASQESLNVASSLHGEAVEAEFKVNEGAVHSHAFFKGLSDSLVQAVIGNVQTQKTFVVLEGLDKGNEASWVVTVSGQGVVLQVQELQVFVHFKDVAELAGSSGAKFVSFQLNLPDVFVDHQHLSQVDTLLFFDQLSRE